MATPFVDAEVIYSASATVDTATINLGSDAGRSVEVVVTCPDGVTISEARIIGGAILTQRSTGLFGTGNYARRYVFADVVTETGAQAIRIVSSGSGLKYGYVVSRFNVGSIRGAASGSNNTAPDDQPSVEVTTVAGDTVSLIGHDFERGGAYTPGGGATERVDDNSAYVQDQIAGGASTTASGTKAAAGTWVAGVTVLVPIAAPAPVLTAPSAIGGSLTGIGRVTSDVAGTLYFRATATSTPATVPAYPGAMAGWSSQAMTVGANSAPFGALAAGTWFPQFAADDGSGNRTAAAVVGGSFVVTAAPATARPGADVTTAGWTPSTGVSFAGVVDEAVPDDADYLISPTLGPSTAPVTMALDTVLAVGTWAIGVRARTTSGTGTVRVYLLNDANTVVGTSGLQAIDSTFTTYTLPVTTTGLATRARIETLAT